MNFLRTMNATADMSATLRQGRILTALHPIKGARNFGKAFEATFSQYTAEQIHESIVGADHHWIRQRAKLFIAELGGHATRGEEMFSSNVAQRIPGFGKVVRASERHMTSFLNLMRVDAFDSFLKDFPNATKAELAAWADYVNVASGRGNLGKFAAVTETLSAVFFAPKFAVSRVQTPLAWFKHMEQPRVRKRIAQSYANLASFGVTTLLMAELAGFEVGMDWRDPDFGKIRVGDTRIDVFGGLQQPIRLALRIGAVATDVVGITESDKVTNPLDLLYQLGSYKLAPAITVPLGALTGKTVIHTPVGLSEEGREFLEENLGLPDSTSAGVDVALGISSAALRALMPMVIEDVGDAFLNDYRVVDSTGTVTFDWLKGAKKAGVVAPLVFLGVGSSTYRDREATVRRNIKSCFRDGDFECGNALMDKWNIEHPDDRIVRVNY